MMSGATTSTHRTALNLCIATSLVALTVVACSTSRPSRTGAFDPPAGGIQFHDPNVRIGDSLWLGLPPITLRRGVKRVSITGLSFASSYPGVSIISTGRISLARDGGRLITTEPPGDLEKDSIQIAGSYIGAAELPGNPIDYGAVLTKFTQAGTYEIVNVVIRYRTPGGTGSQLIPCDFKITVSR